MNTTDRSGEMEERIMDFLSGRTLVVGVVAAILVSMLAVTAAAADPPETSIVVSPTTPDGTPPWYRTTPSVQVFADQSGSIHYSWDGGPESVTVVTTNSPVAIAFPGEGVHGLSAYAVSINGTEPVPASRALYLDATEPTRPSSLSAAVSDDGIQLSWSACSDSGSGMKGYYILRNEDGALYDIGDRIGFSLAPAYTDTDDLDGKQMYYAIQAVDVAGNVGLLSDNVRGGIAARAGGTDREGTAIAASQATFADGTVDTIVVVSRSSYADALCASGLAGAVGSPILLVGQGPIRPDIAAEIARLGVRDAYVVGGTGVVSAQTAASLDSLVSGAVTRLWGQTRYETAAAVAGELRSLTSGTPAAHAYIVSGATFPDALSVASLAYSEAAPIVFATTYSLPWVSHKAILDSGAPAVLIAGGTGAVWSGVEQTVSSSQRAAGVDRYATSIAVADWADLEGVLTGAALVLATGERFPDGLSAGPLAGERGAPVVLTRSQSAGAIPAWISADPARFDEVWVMGGSAAVSDAVMDEVSAALLIQ